MKQKNNLKTKKNTKTALKPISDETHIGTFISKGDFGFIDKQNLYVRKENINTALNKDLVEYIILKNEYAAEDKQYEAQIIKIIKRDKICFAGNVVYKEKEYSYVLLDNPKLNKIVTAKNKNALLEDKVLIKLTNFDPEQLQGTIIKILGNKNDLNIDIKSLLEEYGIKDKFEEKIEKISQKIELDIEGKMQEKPRKDLTQIPVITIDPPDSKDFDDAIGILKTDTQYKLYVAIADVWSYIKDQPEIIEEAEKRSTSIYFLNSVIPMLPEKLCNDFCSLVPNQKRCALMFSVNVDFQGNVMWSTVEIQPCIIISRRRFKYEEINDFLEEKITLSEEPKEIKDLIKHGLELYKLIEKQRIKRGWIQLENPETKFNLNQEGEIVDFYEYIRKDAQFMIENFMIIANEGVARYLMKKKIPGIFRIHEKPEINKIASFISEAKKVNFRIKQSNPDVNQKIIAKWFSENQKHPLIEIVKILLLRSLPKAVYSVNNLGHFGLNIDNYLHFTSPIRRYPDVMIHKMLWEYEFTKKINLDPETIYKKLDKISKHCTEKEIEATEITRTIEHTKITKYLNQHLEKIFKAKITQVSKWGCFAKLENLNLEGFIKTKQNLKLGDLVLIKPIYNNREMKLIKVL